MGDPVKFSSKIDPEVLEALRQHAKETGRSISSLMTEAVASYLERARVRPTFVDLAEQFMDENQELLKRLAQ